MKRTIMGIAAACVCASAGAATPVVSGVSMVQSTTSRDVTISYTLANGPAVITVDIQTNNAAGGWASIGGENIQCFDPDADVWKVVSGDTQHSFVWHADLSWPNHKIPDGGARAVVTAWALDNTPDYMVVDVTPTATSATPRRYYPSKEFLPGGDLNPLYRTSFLLMRKIHAKNVTWTMGSGKEADWYTNEAAHPVTLDHNYYIGVFEVTQSQWANIYPGANARPSLFTDEWTMRPVESVSYNMIRCADHDNAFAGGEWPAAPYQGSFLNVLRTKTDVDFDLPSEAEWEFACRAGHGEGYWNDGSPIVGFAEDANLDKLARYKFTGGWDGESIVYGGDTSHGTAACGSYKPNSWGLYDMYGNAYEWCLDWYAEDITGLGGAVNTTVSTSRSIRGGRWINQNAHEMRSASRSGDQPEWVDSIRAGLRLCCRAGLK